MAKRVRRSWVISMSQSQGVLSFHHCGLSFLLSYQTCKKILALESQLCLQNWSVALHSHCQLPFTLLPSAPTWTATRFLALFSLLISNSFSTPAGGNAKLFSDSFMKGLCNQAPHLSIPVLGGCYISILGFFRILCEAKTSIAYRQTGELERA